MSEREKKLAILFGVALFLIVNAFAINWFQEFRNRSASDLTAAKGKLMEAKNYRDQIELNQVEMDWLNEHRPEPKPAQRVQTELEQFTSNQAANYQLTVKRSKYLPTDETGKHFFRAKVEFVVTGMEKNLYDWLLRLQSPDELRAVTKLQLSPQREDNTKIDCTVTVDQWFLPPGAEVPGAAPEPLEPEVGPEDEAAEGRDAGNENADPNGP